LSMSFPGFAFLSDMKNTNRELLSTRSYRGEAWWMCMWLH